VASRSRPGRIRRGPDARRPGHFPQGYGWPRRPSSPHDHHRRDGWHDLVGRVAGRHSGHPADGCVAGGDVSIRLEKAGSSSMNNLLDPTQRFSDRVHNYVLYRPRYPTAILHPLKIDCRLTSGSIIADVGSGTGFLAEVFLSNGNRVFGIEPNPEMRQAGERLLASWPKFKSVAATAESTSLPDRSVDFVTGGQAFHWFDREACRAEFKRILRPDGWVVLVWNDRRTDSTAFLSAYEQL